MLRVDDGQLTPVKQKFSLCSTYEKHCSPFVICMLILCECCYFLSDYIYKDNQAKDSCLIMAADNAVINVQQCLPAMTPNSSSRWLSGLTWRSLCSPQRSCREWEAGQEEREYSLRHSNSILSVDYTTGPRMVNTALGCGKHVAHRIYRLYKVILITMRIMMMIIVIITIISLIRRV